MTILGQVIADTYRLDREIGSGGWSVVYEAMHVGLHRKVAIKVLSEDLIHQGNAVGRFENEAKVVSHLSHPNIVPVLDYGVMSDGRPYMVMDLIDGKSLSQIITSSGALTYQRALPLFLQICAALESAHSSGILHRDLKPSNVMVSQDSDGKEHAWLLDFGLAKLLEEEQNIRRTRTGETVGTVHYMSPEQYRGNQVDARSDIYSFGCLMYEVLAGVWLFFKAETTVALMEQHLSESAPPLSAVAPHMKIPRALEQVVRAAMEKAPEDRYADVAELNSALTHAGTRDSLSISLQIETRYWLHKVKKVGRSPTSRMIIASAVVLLILGIAAGATLMRHRPAVYVFHAHSSNSGQAETLNADLQGAMEAGDYISCARICDAALKEVHTILRQQPTPNRLDQLMRATRIFLILGRYSDALKLIEPTSATLAKMDETARDMRLHAKSLYARAEGGMGNRKATEVLIDSSIEEGKQVLGEDNQLFAEILSNDGLAYSYIGEYEKAIALYDQSAEITLKNVLETDTSLIFLKIEKGRAYARQGKYDKAQDVLDQAQQAVAMSPGSDEEQHSELLCQLGALAERRGNDSLAMDRYEQAIKEQSKISTVSPFFIDMLSKYSVLLRKHFYPAEADQIDAQVKTMNRLLGRKTDPNTF